MSDDKLHLIDEALSTFNSEHDVDTQPVEKAIATTNLSLSDLFRETYSEALTDLMPAYSRFYEQVRFTSPSGGEYIQPVVLSTVHGVRFEEE